jgi:hypothetical protein
MVSYSRKPGEGLPLWDFKMGDLLLKQTKLEKDQGGHFSNDLKWKSHIETCINEKF